MKLSKNFNLSEFAVSDTYPDVAAGITFNPDEIERIQALVDFILQPLRNHIGEPIYITSGKRSPELNNLVNGYGDSDHLFLELRRSCAVDITCSEISRAWSWIKRHRKVIKFAYIWKSRNYIHISAPDDTGKYGKLKELD